MNNTIKRHKNSTYVSPTIDLYRVAIEAGYAESQWVGLEDLGVTKDEGEW